MNRKVFLSVLACIILLVVGCSERSTPPQEFGNSETSQEAFKFTRDNEPILFDEIKRGHDERDVFELTAEDKEFASRVNRFAFDLFESVLDGNQNNNVFMSPLSVSLALGMQLNGARGGTRSDMLNSMYLSDLDAESINDGYRNLMGYLISHDPDVSLSTANSIWIHEPFPVIPDFVTVNEYYFDAEVENVDFGDPVTIDLINDWIQDRTNGRISDVIEKIPSEAIMYLINAIYMNASWTNQFDTLLSTRERFHTDGLNTVPCIMMKQSVNAPYLDADEFSAVELTYGAGDFSMVLVLPREDLQIDYVAELMGSQWERLSSSFEPTDLRIAIPRFSFPFDIDLEPVLRDLGMDVIFEDGHADFTGIHQCHCIFVSKAIHKAFISVSETGTEAAAVTVIENSFTSLPPEPDMNFNRPFLLMIKESESGLILFMGKIEVPITMEH